MFVWTLLPEQKLKNNSTKKVPIFGVSEKLTICQ